MAISLNKLELTSHQFLCYGKTYQYKSFFSTFVKNQSGYFLQFKNLANYHLYKNIQVLNHYTNTKVLLKVYSNRPKNSFVYVDLNDASQVLNSVAAFYPLNETSGKVFYDHSNYIASITTQGYFDVSYNTIPTVFTDTNINMIIYRAS